MWTIDNRSPPVIRSARGSPPSDPASDFSPPSSGSSPSEPASGSSSSSSASESSLSEDEGVPFELSTFPNVQWDVIERKHKENLVKAISAEVCACFPHRATNVPGLDSDTLVRYRLGDDVARTADYLSEDSR